MMKLKYVLMFFSPLTLIFNELLSNAVIYAYEETKDDKKLFITLKN